MRFKPQLWDMARYEFNSPNWGPATPKTKKKKRKKISTEWSNRVLRHCFSREPLTKYM